MKNILYIVGLALFFLFFLIPYFYVSDPYFVRGLFLSLFLCFLMKNRNIKMTMIDCGLLLILLFNGVSLFTTSNIISETKEFIQCSYVLFYYFLLRYWIKDMLGCEKILLIYAICIGFLSILATAYFFLFKNDIYELEFSSLYDFRFLFRPLGLPNNEWASLQILFAGIVSFAFCINKNAKIRIFYICIVILVLLQILWSFSRGMYLSFVILIIGILAVVGGDLNKKYRWICGVFLFVIIGFTLLYPLEVQKTLKMNETVSQQRSIDCRINMWDTTEDILKEHCWGTGSHTYPMVMDKYLQGDERTESYTSYAMNLISQLLVEKGIPGFLLYLLLFFIVLCYVIQKKDKRVWIIFVFLLTFICREQTFSTFLNSIRIQWLFYTLLAFIQIPVLKEDMVNIKGKYIYLLPLIIWLLCFTGIQWIERNNVYNKECSVAVKYGDWKKAAEWIEKTNRITPYLINRGIIYTYLYDYTLNKLYLQKADSAFDDAQRQNPFDVQINYYRIMIQNRKLNEDNNLLSDLSILVSNYPDKLLYKWTMYNFCLQKEEFEKASQIFVDCILSTPRLMDTEHWEYVVENNPEFIHNITTCLKEQISKEPVDDPIKLAKYGSIALKLGDKVLAEKYLNNALEKIPNLSIAWYNLGVLAEINGDKEKSMIFKRRASVMQGTFISSDLNYLLNGSYNFRFLSWYGCENIKY